jgi:hypothetical protein
VVSSLLVGVREFKEQRFRERPGHELNTDREPVCRKSSRHGQGRKIHERTQTAVISATVVNHGIGHGV